jgi:hypothetical protein
MPTYEDAAKKLARCRDPAPRRRLRDARRDLVSLHARVTAKIATYGLAPWRLPGHLAPSAITAELQGFFREEDARRESLATAVLRFQAEARRELALRCAAALDALDGLAQRIDALSLSDLERVRPLWEIVRATRLLMSVAVHPQARGVQGGPVASRGGPRGRPRGRGPLPSNGRRRSACDDERRC